MNPLPPRCMALLPCAGTGSRAGAPQPKQYQPLLGRPLVAHTVDALAAVPRIARCVAVVAPDDVRMAGLDLPVDVAACGGGSRAQTVFNGLGWLLDHGGAREDWVLVHDAARCLVAPPEIDRLIDACWPDAVGGLLALPLSDTLKQQTPAGRVAATAERSGKWLAQTPQMFRLGALHDAYARQAARDFAGITDEASAMEVAGHAPLLVRGSAQNLKVTYPEDFALAEALLRSRAA